MTEVQVAFLVPVEVLVDLESKTVTKVVAVDEAITMPVDDELLPEVHDRETFELVNDPEIRRKAGEIATAADTEWPAWDHGW